MHMFWIIIMIFAVMACLIEWPVATLVFIMLLYIPGLIMNISNEISDETISHQAKLCQKSMSRTPLSHRRDVNHIRDYKE